MPEAFQFAIRKSIRGSDITVEKLRTEVEMIQKTDYPWSGKNSIVVKRKRVVNCDTLRIRTARQARFYPRRQKLHDTPHWP